MTCFFVLLNLAMAAAPVRTTPPPIGLQFDNGLRVVLQDTPDSESVVIVLRFMHGRVDDPDDLYGTSHLLEHLWYRSTTASGADIWNALSARGCVIDASTTTHFTQFETSCPVAELDFLLAESLRQLADPLNGITEQQVALETSIIFHESGERTTLYSEIASHIYARLQPADHPIHERLAANSQVSGNVNLAKLNKQVRVNFAAEKASMVVAGPLETQEIIETLTNGLGASKPLQSIVRSRQAYTGVSTTAFATDLQITELRSTQPKLMLAWNLDPSLGDSSAMDVFASAMGRTLRVELYEVDEIHSVSCHIAPDITHPALVCDLSLGVEAESSTVLAQVDEALVVALSGKGLKAMKAEVSSSKTQLPQVLYRSLAHPHSNALRLVNEVATYGTLRGTEEVIEDVKDWNPTPLLKAGRSWFSFDTAAKLWVQPGAPTPKATHQEQPIAFAPGPIVTAQSGPTDLVDNTSQMRVLANGLTVVAVRHTTSPIVAATVHVPGGSGQVPYPLAVFSEAFSSAPGVRETLEISTGEAISHGSSQVWAVGPPHQTNRTLRAALAMAALRVPTYNDDIRDHIDRWAVRSASSIAASEHRPEVVAANLLWSHVTPDHRPSGGLTADDIENLAHTRRASVLAHLFQTYTPQFGLLVVSGPQSANELLDLAAETFDPWQTPGGVSKAGPLRPPQANDPIPGRFSIVDPTLNRSTVAWQCRLPEPANYAQEQVLESLVNDQLWRSLRHETGLTYTPNARVSSWPDGTSLLEITVTTEPSQTTQTWQVLSKLIQALPESSTIDIEAIRDRVRRGIHQDATSLFGTEALVIAAFEEAGDPTRPLQHFYDQLTAVQSTAVSAQLAPCFEQGTAVIYGPQPVDLDEFEPVSLPDVEGGAP